jgi:hypothetical protein
MWISDEKGNSKLSRKEIQVIRGDISRQLWFQNNPAACVNIIYDICQHQETRKGQWKIVHFGPFCAKLKIFLNRFDEEFELDTHLRR